jgi:hypothetical protein
MSPSRWPVIKAKEDHCSPFIVRKVQNATELPQSERALDFDSPFFTNGLDGPVTSRICFFASALRMTLDVANESKDKFAMLSRPKVTLVFQMPIFTQ